MTHEYHDVSQALLEYEDGTCRDLNFSGATWDGLRDLVEVLVASYEIESSSDHEGREIRALSGTAVQSVARNGGTVHAVLRNGPAPITRLHLFACSEDDGSPFVELTFFPEHVVKSEALKSEFISWASDLQRILGAHTYYARYENASWRLGDVSAASGVFLAGGSRSS